MDRNNLVTGARNIGASGLHAGFKELGGFRKFILRGNVVDLAVGIVIGAAFTAVVSSVVSGIFTPLIGLFGVPDFANLAYKSANGNIFKFGAVINALITFLITALVVYFFVVRPMNALQDRFTPHHEPAAPTTRDCPFCLSTVPLKATRCAFCTAQLSPVEGPVVS
jgi:large conductance mechanosensitive channel